ncbi:MAG: hypothetical protein M1829_005371 [Trizodia sp. TS-e1964]|nr:MAG: hypothetical protein M1829_005371 [Trizodia sp. TS-e1964]
MWAIHDKNKFQAMVVELRGLNDCLESMFAGLRNSVAKAMKVDFMASENLDELRLLHAATVEDISDVASARLEMLVAPSTARTELLSELFDELLLNNQGESEEGGEAGDMGEDTNTTAARVEPELTKAEKRVDEVDHFLEKKQAELSAWICLGRNSA